MNANELAKLLEVDSWRQQAEQIENLKQWERRHLDVIEKQQAEIETLKKDNKELHAIAQRMAMAESDARKSLQWFKDVEAMGSCAHMELTDEEIIEVWNAFERTDNIPIVDFARAILRKAQEK